MGLRKTPAAYADVPAEMNWATNPSLKIDEPLVVDTMIGHAVHQAYLEQHPEHEANYAEHKSDVEPVIREAREHNGPVLIDFMVDQEENVWPMVPAGAALSETIEMPEAELAR